MNDKNTENKILGEKLRAARRRKKVKIKDLAKEIGFSKDFISGVETGKHGASLLMFIRYGKALNLSPNELLDYESDKILEKYSIIPELLQLLSEFTEEEQMEFAELIIRLTDRKNGI